MAKQQPRPKSKVPNPQQDAPAKASASAGPATKSAVTGPGNPRRSTYVEAVALYEKGFAALQQHDYNSALACFERIISAFPDERELHERVRLYLNVCKRHATPPAAAPHGIQERLYASTLALNGGRYDEAISHLRLVRDEDPDNDHALYMLAVAHAQRGEHAESIAHLERSIALNPENRGQARRDPDLEPLHDDEALLTVVNPSVRRRD